MIKVLLLLSAFGATPASPDEVDDGRAILEEPRYRFCHEEDYPLIDSERGFCEFAKSDDETCPALAKACQAQPEEVDPDGSETSIDVKIEPGARAPAGRHSGRDDRRSVRRVRSGGGSEGNQHAENGQTPDKPSGTNEKPGGAGQGASGDGNRPGKTEEPPPPPKAPDPEVSAAASGFARILFFVLLGGFVAFIVWMIVKNVLSDSDAPPEETPPDDLAPVPQSNAAANAARGVIETDVARLLARARAAAQRGAFAQAIDDLYAALLRRLDGDGIINIQPFRTNGDYLREVRRERSEIAPEVRAILSDVESVHFGARSPSAELFARIHDRVVPLVTKALSVVFFLIAVSGTISCQPLAIDDSAGRDAPFRGDSSPSGIHAITTLLEPHSVDVQQHRNRLEKLPDPVISTLVLLPDFDIGDIGERRLREWVTSGGDLILAGGYDLPEWAGGAVDPAHVGTGPVVVSYSYQDQFGDLSLSIPAGPVLKANDTSSLLLRSDRAYAVYQKLGEGRVIVFADDRWFMNIALPFGDNSAFLISFFQALHHQVHVVDGQTSLGADTPIESIARANLWPIVLQLFLLLVVAFLWRGRAFGVLRDPTVERRRAFADHVRALGLAYARSSASRHVLGIYAAWAIERLRERLPREGRRGLTGLAEALATRIGKSTGEVMRVLVEITDAQKEAAPQSLRAGRPRKDKTQVASDFALFRALDQWLTLTSRETKKSSSRSSDLKTKRKS